ncbi:hypothetical protein [Shouchella patagoniensis]|uniref:hypothetical protein n=1 Tax=Shouchella patagoniensis TaxID=228576 RepID=UPI000994D96A|nr:hypothetical protein [Shouchella patagoniensis]
MYYDSERLMQSDTVKHLTRNEKIHFIEPGRISKKDYLVVVTDHHIYSIAINRPELELKCTIIREKLKDIGFKTNSHTVGYEYISLSVFVEFENERTADRFNTILLQYVHMN